MPNGLWASRRRPPFVRFPHCPSERCCTDQSFHDEEKETPLQNPTQSIQLSHPRMPPSLDANALTLTAPGATTCELPAPTLCLSFLQSRPHQRLAAFQRKSREQGKPRTASAPHPSPRDPSRRSRASWSPDSSVSVLSPDRHREERGTHSSSAESAGQPKVALSALRTRT